MSRPVVVAVDPGGPGAVVVLSPARDALLVCVWKAVRAGWRMSTWWPGGVFQDTIPGRASAIGEYVAERIAREGFVIRALACEDVFVFKNAATAISLARFSGAVISPLEVMAGQEAAYIKASEWRHEVLRMNRRTVREVAKAASLRYIPAMVPGLSDALGGLGQLDHITDAAGIALWRMRGMK